VDIAVDNEKKSALEEFIGMSIIF
jgi:hypothetical protein